MHFNRVYKILSLAIIIISSILLTHCQYPSKPAAHNQIIFDPAKYKNSKQFIIQTKQSELRLLVYKTGPLSSFGHNHVISTHEITGSVYLNASLEKSGLYFKFPVESLSVDNPSIRNQEGQDFTTTLKPDDIAGTRKNMLSSKLLNSQLYPHIIVNSTSIQKDGEQLQINLHLSVKDQTSTITLPLKFTEKHNTLQILGEAEVSHAALGLKPFSLLMGALAVHDIIKVKFNLIAAFEQS